MRLKQFNHSAKPVALCVMGLIVMLLLFIVFGKNQQADAAAGSSRPTKWTCSMCPQFVLPEPGKCPKCFMDLIPLEAGAYGGGARELVISPDIMQQAGITTGNAEEIDAVITIPATAILFNLDRAFVYLATKVEDNVSLKLHEVEAGEKLGDKRAIVSGLEAGQEIAVSGLFRIDSTMQMLGKTSLTNLPDGDLSIVDEDNVEPFQPAERSELDLRAHAIPLDQLFAKYEETRAALAKDDDGSAKAPAAALRDTLDSIKGAGLPEEFTELYASLMQDASSMAAAGDLEKRRAAFEKVSADMTLLARRYGTPEAGLNLIFCPMAFGGKGAHWLQPAEIVDNPYHGLEMPRCGWQVDSIGDKSTENDKAGDS